MDLNMKFSNVYWQVLACCVVTGVSSTAFGALSCGAGDYATCYTNVAYTKTNFNGTTTPVAADIFKASWQLEGNKLKVNIQAETTGWVSLGFHIPDPENPLMDDTDFVIGGYNGSTYSGDYFYNTADPHSAPVLDNNDLSDVSATEVGGVTSFSFSRLLNTESVNDYNLGNGPYDVIWALRTGTSADDVTRIHTYRNLLASNVNFVPVPGAVWLFGSALMGFIGMKQRKTSI